jgi:two-component SAPR family response regulator
MLIEDIEQDMIVETRMVWARKGKKLVRKVRCTSGRKKGRTVANARSCNKAINLKKRFLMRKLLRARGKSMRRKALRTKKFSPLSRRLKTMNKRPHR